MPYSISNPQGKDREKLIGQLSKEGLVLRVWYDEEPVDWDGIEGIQFEGVGKNTYFMSPPYAYSQLVHWLFMGGWRMSIPHQIETPIIDTFREDPEKVGKVLEGLEIECLIDSFHDNMDWRVFRRSDIESGE